MHLGYDFKAFRDISRRRLQHAYRWEAAMVCHDVKVHSDTLQLHADESLRLHVIRKAVPSVPNILEKENGC